MVRASPARRQDSEAPSVADTKIAGLTENMRRHDRASAFSGRVRLYDGGNPGPGCCHRHAAPHR